MSDPGPKWAFPAGACLILGLGLVLSGFSGCADSGQLHPFVGQEGLLAPMKNPDGLVENPEALTMYLGDTYNDRKEGGQVLFGHSLARKLRGLLGGQVSELCRSLPCYVDAAKAWHKTFILQATVRKNDDAEKPDGLLTVTWWSVQPLFPGTTISLSFPLGKKPTDYEKLLARAVDRIIRQRLQAKRGNLTNSREDGSSRLSELLSEGKVDQALRLGERLFGRPEVSRLPKSFFFTLYRLEESVGKPEMANRVGRKALETGRASPALLLDMARNARTKGDVNEERNIFFRGVALYPRNRSFWRFLIRERIRDGHYKGALELIDRFDKINPPLAGHPHFVRETYGALVGSGRGNAADRWFQAHIGKKWKEDPKLSPFLAHAVMMRYFQQGQWKKAEETASGLIRRGIQSDSLYRDWMTALGAENESITEVHVGREAIARGFRSRWIRDQVTFLERKGY